jgi:hypothetical protein
MSNKINELKNAIASTNDKTIKQLLNDALNVELKNVDKKTNERKYWLRQKLLMQRAIDAGIIVSNDDVDIEYKKSFPNE